jgi:streptogramin lyase
MRIGTRRFTHLSVAVSVAAGAVTAIAAIAAPGRVVVKTPGFPTAMIAANGSLWVLTHRGGYVYRVDPRTNKVMAAVDVGDAMCFIPTANTRRLWISNCWGESGVYQSYEIDVRTNRVVGTVKGSVPVLAAGSLWTVTSGGVLLRLDPQTRVRLAAIGTKLPDPNPGGVAYGSLWVSSNSAVARIDPNTNKVTALVPLPGAKTEESYAGGYLAGRYAAFAAGKVWVTNAAGLYEIDPSTNTARLIRVPLKPHAEWGDVQIAFARGSLWLRLTDTVVARLDPRTARIVARYPASGGGGGLAIAFGSLWVANAGAHTVWREPIRE